MSKNDESYYLLIDTAKKHLDYNPDTGLFTHKNTEKQYGKTRDGETAGSISSNGFIKIKVSSKALCAHKLAFLFYYGFIPKNGVYHKNGNRSNNSIINLCAVPDTHSYSAWMKKLANDEVIKSLGLDSKLISRDEAIAAGLNRYFTGIECKNGHIAERHVTGRCCVSCSAEFSSRDDQKKKRSEAEKNRVLNLTESEKQERLERMNNWYYNNKDRVIERRETNRDRMNEWYRKYRARKIKDDSVFAMSVWLRQSLNRILRATTQRKSRKTFDMFGYNPFELKEAIQSKFTDNMSWENRSEWHIDHIVPVKVLIDNGVTNPAIINHLDNLKPEWAEYNLSKGDKCYDFDLLDRLIKMNKAE